MEKKIREQEKKYTMPDARVRIILRASGEWLDANVKAVHESKLCMKLGFKLARGT